LQFSVCDGTLANSILASADLLSVWHNVALTRFRKRKNPVHSWRINLFGRTYFTSKIYQLRPKKFKYFNISTSVEVYICFLGTSATYCAKNRMKMIVYIDCSASEKARDSWKKYLAYENSKIVGRKLLPQISYPVSLSCINNASFHNFS